MFPMSSITPPAACPVVFGCDAVSFIGSAIGSVLGGITGSNAAAKGAKAAANTQASAADRAIAEQREARLSNEQRQQPFVNAGTSALAQQMALIGLNGTTGQQGAINALLASPEYTTSVRQGEESILANASATGGLRGGNTQNSLAGFRADLVGQLINQQYSRLGGLTSLGQNAAAGVGNAGMSSANSISSLLNQQGAAIAGGQIAAGNAGTNAFNTAIGAGGLLLQSGLLGGNKARIGTPPIAGF